MSQEAIVTAQDVLRAISDLKRRGLNAVLRELESTEPELTEHLLEETTQIHHKLYKASLSHEQHQRLTRRLQRLCAVLVQATRNGYRRLLVANPDQTIEPNTDRR